MVAKKFLVFSFILCVLIFYAFNSANAAGFFSFIKNLLYGNHSVSSQSEANSQNIPLLHAALNPIVATASGGGDITIVGQSALLPDVGPLGSIADIEDRLSQGQISIYVVREGDTLTQIAEMFDISVNTILWANNLNRNDRITPGQTLVMLPVPGILYEVKEGDTIASIAKKWKGDVDEIIQFNDFSPNQKLSIGMTVIVPNAEAPIPPSTNVSSSSYRGGSGSVYAGYYIRPIVSGRISQGLHGYNAIDWAAPCGTPILASASGDVIMSRTGGWNGGYGNFVIIDYPNDTQTLTAHMSEIIVGTGWHVVQGQVIGYVGITGNTTGCHVHFEVRGASQPR